MQNCSLSVWARCSLGLSWIHFCSQYLSVSIQKDHNAISCWARLVGPLLLLLVWIRSSPFLDTFPYHQYITSSQTLHSLGSVRNTCTWVCYFFTVFLLCSGAVGFRRSWQKDCYDGWWHGNHLCYGLSHPGEYIWSCKSCTWFYSYSSCILKAFV